MKKLIRKIRVRIMLWHERCACRIDNNIEGKIKKEAQEAIQIMLYNEENHICMFGIPLLNEHDLTVSLEHALRKMRGEYVAAKYNNLCR